MKDLKDVMVTNSVIDFNNGLQTGAQIERSRIIELLEEDADNNYYALQLIKGEQK